MLLGLLEIYDSICITNSNYIVAVTHQLMCFQFKIIISSGWKAVLLQK